MFKRYFLALIVLVLSTGIAQAQPPSENSQDPKQRIYIAADFGAFFPTASSTKDRFDSTWPQFSLDWFKPMRPTKWVPTADITWFSHSDGGSALLVPLTIGVERAFSNSRRFQPYAAVRLGAFYGNAHAASFGASGNTIGFDANAMLGMTISQRYFIELRYDVFTRFADTDFNGFSAFAGVRFASFKL